MNKVKSICQLINVVIKSKRNWSKIEEKKTVIYHDASIDLFGPLVGDYVVVANNSSAISMRALVSAMFNRKFYSDPWMQYVFAYIGRINPRFVFTVIDNDPIFMRLSKQIPSATTIMVQNGMRYDICGVLDSVNLRNDEVKVDFTFTFGDAYAEFIQKIVGGVVTSVGSFRSNEVPVVKSLGQSNIVFVSQVGGFGESVHLPLENGKSITWEQHNLAETDLLPLIKVWCDKNGHRLQILLRSREKDEEDFFVNLVPGKDWEFIKRPLSESCYTVVDRAGIVCGISSTLLLESLSRGNKTAIFGTREEYAPNYPSVFWPAQFEKTGYFWTNKANYNEIERIFTYLLTVTDDNWHCEVADHMSDILMYCPGNLLLYEKIEQIVTGSPSLS